MQSIKIKFHVTSHIYLSYSPLCFELGFLGIVKLDKALALVYVHWMMENTL